jgi:hypothetical protein
VARLVAAGCGGVVLRVNGSLGLARRHAARYSAVQALAARTGAGRPGDRVDIAQAAVLLVGWVVAFLLGKELQAGFLQWRQGRRGE